MKKIMLIFIAMFISCGSVWAEIPSFSVVLGERAYSLGYANDNGNIEEIRNAMKESGGKIFIKTKNKWYKNDNTVVTDLNEIPKVTYIKGYSKHEKDDSTEEIFSNNSSLGKKIRVQDGKVELYSNNERKWVVIKETTIKNLNMRCYRLLEYLLKTNTKNNYIYGYYGSGSNDTSAIISLTSDKESQIEVFTYSFFDTKKLDYLDNVNINLKINPLSDEETGKESLESYYYTPYYVEKLKKSIEIVFYDKDHEAIYDLIMRKYEKSKEYTQEGIGDKMFKDEDFVDGIKIITERSYNGFDIYFEV